MSAVERLAAFVGQDRNWALAVVFVAFVCVEALRPERSRETSLGWRWATNLGLYTLNEGLLRFVIPFGLVVSLLAALGKPHVLAFSAIRSWGGPWAMLAASCVALDLISYLLHRTEHAVFPLWRLHAVHHADVDVDATTAVRHHPLEAAFSGIVFSLCVLMLGMPFLALPLYALFALLMQVAQHANFRLPPRLDATLAFLVMTPGLHRAHHAVDPRYYNANYGTVLSMWDRCFFTLAPPLPHENPPGFGVTDFADARFVRPQWALMQPFLMRRKPKSGRHEAAQSTPDPGAVRTRRAF